jgi:hypothetical protein
MCRIIPLRVIYRSGGSWYFYWRTWKHVTDWFVLIFDTRRNFNDILTCTL